MPKVVKEVGAGCYCLYSCISVAQRN